MFVRIIRLRYHLLYAAAALGMAGLLFFPRECAEAARDSVSVCLSVVIPTLFPFFVFSAFAVESGLSLLLGRAMAPAMRLFRVGGAAGSAFVLGLVSGFPVGAKTAISLYENGQCTKTESERLLSFCNNTGPAFILGSVGIGIFNSQSAGLLLYGAQVAASVLTGVLFGIFWRGKNGAKRASRPPKSANAPLLRCFLDAVRSGGVSVFNICVFVVFFSVAIRLLFVSGAIPAAAAALGRLLAPLGVERALLERLFTGFFEVVSGVRSAGGGGLGAENLALTGAILGWAGLSVHCQVLSFLSGSGLSARPYLIGKLLQSAFAALFTYLLALAAPLGIERPAFSSGSQPVVAVTGFTFYRALALSGAALLLLFMLSVLAAVLSAGAPSRRAPARQVPGRSKQAAPIKISPARLSSHRASKPEAVYEYSRARPPTQHKHNV